MITICFLLILPVLAFWLLNTMKSLGKIPAGGRLKRITSSRNYRNGRFVNQAETVIYIKKMKLIGALFSKSNKRRPKGSIPSIKCCLSSPTTNGVEVVWFGHSSYLLSFMGIHILVDPVFADTLSLGIKSYPGSSGYTVTDMPDIDAVIISHDHHDHLDYRTILNLKDQHCIFYVPLGVGAHLEFWGIPRSRISEMDWWDEIRINGDSWLIATPARHFSGRGLLQNKTLWASYVLRMTDHCIFIGGDSGYGQHFKEIGDRFGPFDLVILECGQYGDWWPHIHMKPKETVQAAIDLKGRTLLPVHWCKFSLALHSWDEPIKSITQDISDLPVSIVTPMIGERIIVGNTHSTQKWWESVDAGDLTEIV